jgi:exonuclease VII large subunit
MPRANVRSLDSVQRFRPKVAQFEDDLASALTSLRVEISRTLQWIDHDCPSYWQNQVRQGFDRVAEARTQLTRKSMMTVAGHRSECIDEKKALAKAKANLELAQQKIQACRQWSIKAHHAADEYTARVGRVEQHVGKSLPRIKTMLDRMIAALEDYAAVARGAGSELNTLDMNATVEVDPTGTAEQEPAATTAAEPQAADSGLANAAGAQPEAVDAGPDGGTPDESRAPASPVAAARSRS